MDKKCYDFRQCGVKPDSRHFPFEDSQHIVIYSSRGAMGARVLEAALSAAREDQSPFRVSPATEKHEVLGHDLAGLISATGEPLDEEEAAAQTYPVINVSNRRGRLPGVGNLLSDDAGIGRMAADYFFEKGHREILVLHIEGHVAHSERAAGCAERARKCGMHVSTFSHDFHNFGAREMGRAAYFSALRELLTPELSRVPFGGAIFCSNDWLAGEVIKLLQFIAPELLDASGILGVDNDAGRTVYHGLQMPTISSIDPGFAEMGRRAFRWLASHPGPDGRQPVRRLMSRIPAATIVERESTSAWSCSDPLTARMIRWAWKGILRGNKVTVSEMARHHRLNQKTLERRFQQYAGCNAVELIARLRLDRALSLLKDTRRPITEIALCCGYAKHDALSRAVRQALGCTPRDYRKQHATHCGVDREEPIPLKSNRLMSLTGGDLA